MYIATDMTFNDEMKDIVRNELNVKEVLPVNSAEGFADYQIKPQMRTLGPKYGKILGKIREKLANLKEKAREVVDTVKSGALFHMDVDGQDVELAESDLLISSANKEGYSVVSDHGDTVALDVTLTDKLVEEGHVREIISKIQSMRKESDFVVTDHIDIGYKADGELADIFVKYADDIANGTLADSVHPATSGTYEKDIDVNGSKVTLYLTKA